MSQIAKHFAPGWFAAVMGTAVIAVAIFVFRQYLPFAAVLQRFFLGTAVLLFTLLLIPWLWRWLRYRQYAVADLRNPVSAAFFPTMPISLLVIGVALEKTPLSILPEAARWGILQALWLAGAAGILIFALLILSVFFRQPEIKWESSTLGWLIPPVSALLVPVLGASLATHYATSGWGMINLVGSLLFLGIGSVLFLAVLAVVLTRYIFYALPPVHLTPTLWVGIAPTSILAILALRWVTPLQKLLGWSDTTAATLNALALPVAIALWGFAFFWLLLAMGMTWQTKRTLTLPFALSWWAFVFPTGAFAVSTGVVYQALPTAFFLVTGLGALLLVLLLWLITLLRTLRGIRSGALFAPHAPAPAAQR